MAALGKEREGEGEGGEKDRQVCVANHAPVTEGSPVECELKVKIGREENSVDIYVEK